MAQAVRVFTPTVEEVSRARSFARDLLSDWGIEADDVILVVSELAANAIRHADSEFEVSLRNAGDAIVVEVTDSAASLPVLLTAPPTLMAGRGLLIVDQLARSWGVRRTPEGGKTVWAEIAPVS
jgi:anti-sigma regulatory factor (Ser/Thr protein kinase)